jgi:hypothetical protein
MGKVSSESIDLVCLEGPCSREPVCTGIGARIFRRKPFITLNRKEGFGI